MKTRITALLLVLVMAFAMTTVAFAADAASPRPVSTEVGNGLVTATVYLEEGEGLTNGRISVSYSPEAATLEGA